MGNTSTTQCSSVDHRETVRRFCDETTAPVAN